MLSRNKVILLMGPLCLFVATSIAQVSVLTQHNDLGRTGQNLNETTLNTSNVNVSSFGKLFWRTVDGYIYAQPLYVPALSIQGKTRNVVYVGTQHNSVYAFDADDPAQVLPLWRVNLGTPVPSQDICVITGNTSDCPFLDINPEIGITSTPVIDSSAGIIYVVAKTKNLNDSSYHFFLHALDLKTGAERLGGPAEIVGQVVGGGVGSSGGILPFTPLLQLQRPGLLLLNGVVYVAFGSVGDIGAFHGWIMGYDPSTLQQTTIFNVTPNGSDGGIWQAGAGLASDGVSNIYAMTGNGDFNADVAGGKDYGDSVLKLGTSNGLAVLDYFTPSNQAALFSGDLDLGSGGPITIPGTSLLVGIGKDKIFRLVDSSNMGHFNAGFDNDVQEFTAGLSAFFGAPVYWDSPNNGPVVYLWPPKDFLKAFKFVGGQFQTTPITQSTMQNSTGFANAAPISLSANSLLGSGILWSSASFSGGVIGPSVPGILRAFDATNLGTELWDSRQNAARDDVGTYAKFVPPTVANGRVYVGTFSGQLQVYGLAPPPASGIRFVQLASATSTTTTASASAAYPSSQSAGDLNVVVISWKDSTSTVQSVTDSLGNSYTLAVGPTTGTALRQSIYFAKNIRAGSNSVTVAFNSAASSPDLRILEYSGADTVNPFEVSAGAAGNSSVADSGSIVTANANDLIIGANIVGAKNLVAGSPFFARLLTSTPANIVEDRMVNVPGSYNAWAPLLSTAPWAMQVVAFKAAASTSGTAPTIGAISPSSGPIAGGTAVTVTGKNFAAGATVSLGGTAATGVIVVNSTTIMATTAAHTAGAVNVVVTNADAQSGTLPNSFTYVSPNPAPSVTAITPTSGTTGGGTAVSITGMGFLAGAAVSLGGTAATGVTVVNSTTITATTPAHSVGTVNVAVTNTDGKSGSLPNSYTYTTSGGGGSIAFVQVKAATPSAPSASVAVTYPLAQTAGNLNIVAVGWNDTTSTVSTISDSRGNIYTLAIGPTSGTGLRQSIYYAKNIAGGSNTVTVTFNQAGTFVDVRALEYSGLDTANPLDQAAGAAGTGTLANSGAQTTTSANELIFGAGMIRTHFTGAGSGFISRIITNPDADIAEDQTVSSTGTYNATAPATSANWVMQMATFRASGQGSGNPAPMVATITPTSGTTAGGTAVTITGTGFLAGATVSLGGTAATGVTVVDSTTITATTAAHAAGAVNVVVTNTDAQSGTLSNGYTYTSSNPAPTVTSISPTSGTTAGGTAVSITGTGFLAGATVSLGGTAATGVTVVNSTTITATTAARAAGVVNVVVTNTDAKSDTLPNGYTYITSNPAPTVTSISPTSGTTAGGTAVSITGIGFMAGATVSLGGTAATGVTVVNSTTITATTPAHAAGAVNVVVTNTDAQSGTLPNSYTYTTSTGGGPIAFVQVKAATPSAPSTSVSVTYTLAQSAGNLNVVAVGWNDATSTVSAISDSRGNTYTLAIGPTTGTGLRQSIYYAKNIVAGSNTVTVTFNQAAAFVDVRALEYSGLDTANPLDVAAGAAGTGILANSGVMTTTSASELIFGAGMTSTHFTGPGSGFISRIITNPDADIAEDQVVSSTGSYSASAPATSSRWVMQVTTFRAAP